MTICAAAIGPDGVWIGSDGHEEWDGLVTSQASRKWALSPCGQWAISFSGEAAYQDAVEQMFGEDWQWPAARDAGGVRQLLSRLRAGLAAIPQAPQPTRKEDGGFPSWAWAPLIVTEHGIWQPDGTLFALGGAIRNRFLAAGVGRALALGAMSALLDAGCESAERLVRAGIATACRLSTGCGGEQWIHRMGARIAAAA